MTIREFLDRLLVDVFDGPHLDLLNDSEQSSANLLKFFVDDKVQILIFVPERQVFERCDSTVAVSYVDEQPLEHIKIEILLDEDILGFLVEMKYDVGPFGVFSFAQKFRKLVKDGGQFLNPPFLDFLHGQHIMA